ncbi:hypothetical protein C8R46DRAFT_1220406 [Mycena filopes]|nr:hypothetical protein C8R46DRAFT_1220406 [Mycena filopes]
MRSTEFHTKRALVEVCRTWYCFGLKFLYESVILQQIDQLSALVTAVENHVELGTLVRVLEISYFIPSGYHGIHDAETKKLLDMCPRLTHLVFHPQGRQWTLPIAMHPISRSITNLDMGDWVEYSAVLPTLVHLCETLKSLTLSLPDHYDDSHPTLTFAHLESLRLCSAIHSVFPAIHWVMPCLHSLSLRHNSVVSAFPADLHLAFTVLQRCGSTVKHLRVADLIHCPTSPLSLQDVLDQCPVLEYLGACKSHLEASGAHGTLHSLDIFGRQPELREETAAHLRSAFPGLRVYRYVPGYHSFLPHSLPRPPHTVGPGEAPVGMMLDATHCNFPTGSWLDAIAQAEMNEDGDHSEYENGEEDGTESDSDSDCGAIVDDGEVIGIEP